MTDPSDADARAKCLQLGMWVSEHVVDLRQHIETEPNDQEGTIDRFESALGVADEAGSMGECGLPTSYIEEHITSAKSFYEAGDKEGAIRSLSAIETKMTETNEEPVEPFSVRIRPGTPGFIPDEEPGTSPETDPENDGTAD